MVSREEFVNEVNKLRLQNKGNWYFWSGNVNGKSIRIKGFNTWLQIFTVDEYDVSSEMDISVSKFKQNLLRGVEE